MGYLSSKGVNGAGRGPFGKLGGGKGTNQEEAKSPELIFVAERFYRGIEEGEKSSLKAVTYANPPQRN